MNERVLVAYASKHGATKEMAETIGQALRRRGVAAEVAAVEQAGDPAGYAGVVLGSAVYYGMWRRGVTAFIKSHERVLAGKKVWLFSSGPTGSGDPLALTKGWKHPEALRPWIERIQPRDVALFNGRIDAGALNFFERFIARKVKAPLGDFRDLNAVAAWAETIAAAVQGGA